MSRSKFKMRRIAFVIEHSSKAVREWFRGTMLYTRHNPNWFVRIFETSQVKGDPYIDFGSLLPHGVILCGTPLRAARAVLDRMGGKKIPIVAVQQEKSTSYPHTATVGIDADTLARTAIEFFQRRGCRHVAYVGAHIPSEIRSSRHIREAFETVARQKGLPCFVPHIFVHKGMCLRVTDGDHISGWLRALPKPCGILVWDDNIGRDMLDLCRLNNVNVPGGVYMLGIDDNALVCENSTPALSSVALDYERTAFVAARTLDEMIDRKLAVPPHIVCGVKGVTERAATQDPRGSGRLVALACEFIAKNACRDGGLDQVQIAKHFGVSVRTLQLRFKTASFPRTILQEIQRVQLERVCRLLATTDRAIGEITFLSGFGSLSRLKALFQAKFGMSMREYRKQSRTATPPPK